MSLRNLTTFISNTDSWVLFNDFSTAFPDLQGIDLDKSGILSSELLKYILPDSWTAPYDVEAGLSKIYFISRVSEPLALSIGNLDKIRDALSDAERAQFDTELNNLINTFNNTLAPDFEGLGLEFRFELADISGTIDGAVGFGSVFFGNIADQAFGYFQGAKDLYDTAVATIQGAITIGNGLVSAYPIIDQAIHNIFESLRDDALLTDFLELNYQGIFGTIESGISSILHTFSLEEFRADIQSFSSSLSPQDASELLGIADNLISVIETSDLQSVELDNYWKALSWFIEHDVDMDYIGEIMFRVPIGGLNEETN